MSIRYDIVGARVGSIITNNVAYIKAHHKEISEWLDRDRMRLMAGFDLGKNWENMASGPTLFYLHEDGTCSLPEKIEE